MLWRRFATSSLIAVLPFVLAACGSEAPSDPRAGMPLVRVAVVRGETPGSRAFTGIVAARVQSDLGFRVAGKVLQRLVDTGQTVERGQVLLRLDPADLKLAANAQIEAVAAARARALQTAQEEARYRDLRGTGAVSASAYDQAKAAADAAKAQLGAAEAQADVTRNATRYAELVADGNGVVMETLVEAGQVVNAGQTVVRLAHAGQREAVVQLPETLRPAIGTTAEASLFGRQGAPVPAKLRQLSSTADRLTRTFEARYVLESALANASLGSTVTLQIPDGASTGRAAMVVPIGALFDAGQGPGVWVINGDPAKVSWRPVQVQGLADDAARIAGPIKQGERIVALGAHLLREGEQVRVAGPAPAAAGATPGMRP